MVRNSGEFQICVGQIELPKCLVFDEFNTEGLACSRCMEGNTVKRLHFKEKVVVRYEQILNCEMQNQGNCFRCKRNFFLSKNTCQ